MQRLKRSHTYLQTLAGLHSPAGEGWASSRIRSQVDSRIGKGEGKQNSDVMLIPRRMSHMPKWR